MVALILGGSNNVLVFIYLTACVHTHTHTFFCSSHLIYLFFALCGWRSFHYGNHIFNFDDSMWYPSSLFRLYNKHQSFENQMAPLLMTLVKKKNVMEFSQAFFRMLSYSCKINIVGNNMIWVVSLNLFRNMYFANTEGYRGWYETSCGLEKLRVMLGPK